jgi:hypothetical protein
MCNDLILYLSDDLFFRYICELLWCGMVYTEYIQKMKLLIYDG